MAADKGLLPERRCPGRDGIIEGHEEVNNVTRELLPIPFEEFARRLPTIFDAIAKEHQAVVVERNGQLYRLAPQPKQPAQRPDEPQDIWQGYDPERVKEALRLGAGVLAGIDRQELLEDVRAQRSQDSRGRPA